VGKRSRRRRGAGRTRVGQAAGPIEAGSAAGHQRPSPGPDGVPGPIPPDLLAQAERLYETGSYTECADLLLGGPPYWGAEYLACDALLRAEAFDRVVDTATAALAREGQREVAALHHLAARGLLGHRSPYRPPEEHQASIQEHLEAAVGHPDAEPGAFRLLAIQLSLDDSDISRRRMVDVLRAGLAAHPGDAALRARAVEMALDPGRNPALARQWLAPLLPGRLGAPGADGFPPRLSDEPETLADVPNLHRWLAYEVELASGDGEAAATWARSVVVDEPGARRGREMGRQLVVAGALLEAGRFDAAEAEFRTVIAAGAPSSEVAIAHLGLAAAAYERTADVPTALSHVDTAIDHVLSQEDPYFDPFFDLWATDGLHQYVEPAWLVRLCDALEPAANADAASTDDDARKVASRLLFLQTRVVSFRSGRHQAETSPEDQARLRDLVARTEAACDDPRYAQHLASVYFERLKDRVGYFERTLVAAVHDARTAVRRGEEVYRHEWYLEENFGTKAQGFSPEDVRALHGGLLAGLRRSPRAAALPRDEAEAVRDAVFLPTYEDLWRPMLRAGALETPFAAESLQATSLLFVHIEPLDVPASIAFDAGLRCQQEGGETSAKNAEAFYRYVLDRDPHAAAAHNLAILLAARKTPEALAEAQALATQAAAWEPDNEQMARHAAALRESAARAQQARQDAPQATPAATRAAQRREDFLRSAVARFPQLDQYKRQILAALSVVSGYDGIDHLAQLSGVEARSLRGHLHRLVEAGMVEDGPGGLRVNPHIAPLIERERTHAMATKLIRADESLAIKPVFNSRQEYNVYALTIGLFPNHLVLPNLGLQAIFQYDRMKALVDSETFGYYLRASVDLCVVSTATYFPIVAFEVDSHYHDGERQQAKDAKKDLIFRRGGVGLIRLRAFGRPTPEGMRTDIIRALHEYGSLHRADERVAEVLRQLRAPDATPGLMHGAPASAAPPYAPPALPQ
jgi:hypothetical protein